MEITGKEILRQSSRLGDQVNNLIGNTKNLKLVLENINMLIDRKYLGANNSLITYIKNSENLINELKTEYTNLQEKMFKYGNETLRNEQNVEVNILEILSKINMLRGRIGASREFNRAP